MGLDFGAMAIRDGAAPDEVNVFALAAKWSIDSSTLGQRLDPGVGLGGVLPPP